MSIPASGIPRIAPSPNRPGPAPKPKPGRAPWGALELIAVSPTVFPALLYIPGMFALRTPLRILDFTLVLFVWAFVLARGRREVGRPFLPRILLGVCAAWLLVSILHPTTNSLVSGTAEAILVISIMSPALWVPQLKITPQRFTRMIRLVFLVNLLSALWGLGQVYMPERFNPPDFQRFQRFENDRATLSLTTASGREIIRPCGLTDTPGGAAAAAVNVVLIGLIWALRPMALWRRALLVGLSFVAMGVIYLSQVRAALLSTVASLMVTAGLFALRRNFGKATVLAVGIGSLAAAGLAWTAFVGGEEAISRFAALLDDDAVATFQKNRGGFIQTTLEEYIPRYPFGAGLGRWGQIYYYFGNKSDPFGVGRGGLYSEVQITAWTFDGGLPLIFGYSAAILLAMWHVFRIALHGREPDIAYWACAVFAVSLTLLALCMSSMPFIGPTGVQFWLMVTALYTVDQQAAVARNARAAAARRGLPA